MEKIKLSIYHIDNIQIIQDNFDKQNETDIAKINTQIRHLQEQTKKLEIMLATINITKVNRVKGFLMGILSCRKATLLHVSDVGLSQCGNYIEYNLTKI